MAHTPGPDDPGFFPDHDEATKSLGAATPAANPAAAAHDALDRAIVNVGKGIETYPVVNVTTLTDELRAAGVQITVGRHGRPAHYGRPAAAERAAGAAPFGNGTRVRLVKPLNGRAVGAEAEVFKVFKRDDHWCCGVEWADAGISNRVPVDHFELAEPPIQGTIVECPDAALLGKTGAVTLDDGRGPGERDGRPRPATPPPDDYRLTVVVSGAEFEVDVTPASYIGDVIGRALAAAGVSHDPASTWYLREKDGTVLDAGKRLGEYALLTSHPLFLDPEAGGGACQPAIVRSPAAEAVADDLATGAGWQGTPPAEGTRRRLILDTINRHDVKLHGGWGGKMVGGNALDLADTIEKALLEVARVNDLFGLDDDGAVVLEEAIGPDPVTELRIVVDDDTPASLMHAGPKFVGVFDQHGKDFGYGQWVHSTSKRGVRSYVVRVKPWQGDRQKLEVEAIGWLSAELAARAGAWAGNAPDWFPQPPEWLELWDKAIAAVRAGEPLPQPPERPAATFETDEAALRRISGELVEANRERIGAGNELDRVSIPRSLEPGTTLRLPERVKMLVERSLRAEEEGRVARELTELGPEDRGFLAQLVKNYLDEGGDFLIYSPVFAREVLGILGRPHVGVSPVDAEGPRDGELRIVLEPTEEGDRFVELEDGEGNSVSLPRVRSERRPFTEIVIPPPAVLAIGDGLSEHTGERIAKALETLNTSAGGALRELLDRDLRRITD
jgi:hypothetical protein